MQWRYGMAIIGAIIFLSVSMIGIYRFTDVIIYAMAFNIPFSMFSKVFCQQDVSWAVMPGFSFGMLELLLFMAYTSWFIQIFVARLKPLPKFSMIDFFILILFLTQIFSLFKAPAKTLAFFDIIHNVKHFLMYFYIAHHVKKSHLKLIIILILFAIMLESSIALFERVTGNVGIGSKKGDFTSSEFGTQKKVPGIEYQIRSEGTTAEPHILGEYFAMILPIPFVFMMMRKVKHIIRFILVVIFIIGVGGLIVTFSRSGWCAFAIAAGLTLLVMVFSWKQISAAVIALILFISVSAVYPQGYEYAFDRLFRAPGELLTSRFDMNRTAIDIWKKNLFFGYGPANYMHALEDPDIVVYGEIDRSYHAYPVHNMLLYIGSENGIFGVIGFFGAVFCAIRACWKVHICDDFLIKAMAVAIGAGLVAYLLDGITNCLARQSVVYAQLWVYLGLSIAFDRMLKERSNDAKQLPVEI